MTAHVIDGKKHAAQMREQIARKISDLKKKHTQTPGLAVILVGHDPASEVYVRSKSRQTVEVGMASFKHELDETTSEDTLLALIDTLNTDPKVHGILVQLPLPDHINTQRVINAIIPAKDVDGFSILNTGLLVTEQQSLIPCTPLGCLKMLKAYHGDLSGLNAVVVGRSNIVGKPMAHLLLRENCTVTVAHSRTTNLPDICKTADILVAAVGRAEMIQGDWVKPGATVIDVGINRITDTQADSHGKTMLKGDVHFDSAFQVAGAITPVPGGVGPMTIACLLANTLTAFCRIEHMEEPDGLL